MEIVNFLVNIQVSSLATQVVFVFFNTIDDIQLLVYIRSFALLYPLTELWTTTKLVVQRKMKNYARSNQYMDRSPVANVIVFIFKEIAPSVSSQLTIFLGWTV